MSRWPLRSEAVKRRSKIQIQNDCPVERPGDSGRGASREFNRVPLGNVRLHILPAAAISGTLQKNFLPGRRRINKSCRILQPLRPQQIEFNNRRLQGELDISRQSRRITHGNLIGLAGDGVKGDPAFTARDNR